MEIESTEYTLWIVVGVLTIIQLLYTFILYYAPHRRIKAERKEQRSLSGNPPGMSVIIATSDCEHLLEKHLPLILQQEYPDFEVIVVDDNSKDDTRELVGRLSEQYPNLYGTFTSDSIRYISHKKLALMLGIKAAKGEIIAFIDDDAYPDAHWLEYAVRYFGDETIGAVGGPGVTPPGDSFLARMGGRVYDNLLVSGNYRYRYKAGGVRRDVDDYPSCNLFVRKSLLDSFGGYRTDFWPGEDTLLCKDIVDAGKRIVYDPWVVVCHHRRPLFGAHLRQLGRYAFHRGYFCKRYPSNSLRLSYFIPTLFVAYLFIWAILVAIPQPDVMSVELFCIWQGIISVPMLTYILLVLLTSFSLNPAVWIITLCGVLATHVTYGIRFLGGLLAKKAPCEFIGKDHA